jgi:hypothetical protein
MGRFTRSSILLAVGVFVAAASCGEDKKPTQYGYACTLDDECESKRCIDGFCSKTCTKLSDCPSGSGRIFVCGAIDAQTVACHPKRVDDREYGTGHDCSLDGKCGIGWKCMGPAGSADRYCSPICESDKECLPTMRCASVKEGKKDAEKRCVKRLFGHPCVINDQCGNADDLCITDSNGAKYCSKACEKTSAGTCPEFTKCQDAGNNKFQCKFKKGYAYKAEGDLCDPCIFHSDILAEEGTCKTGGICFRLSGYTNEAACALPCETQAPSCPEGYGCTSSTQVCVPIAPGSNPPQIGTCAP